MDYSVAVFVERPGSASGEIGSPERPTATGLVFAAEVAEAIDLAQAEVRAEIVEQAAGHVGFDPVQMVRLLVEARHRAELEALG